MAHATIHSLYDMDRLLGEYYPDEAVSATKADAPILTTTSGYWNTVYGAKAWDLLSERDTLFGLLPKAAWEHSGWRMISARAGTAGQGGTAENGAVNDTLKPTIVLPTGKPKTVQTGFEESEVNLFLSTQSDDDAFGRWEDLKAHFADTHRWDINAQLNTNVGTLAGNNFESIDRIVSSFGEIAAQSLDAGDADFFGLDRDAGATAYDGVVYHNSNVNRALTDTLVRSLIADVSAAKGANSFFYTGFSTYSNLQGIYGDQARYGLPQTKAKVTINGVESAAGSDVGLSIGTVYGIPVFQDNTVIKDNTTTGDRLYLLDISNPEGMSKPRLGIDVAKPTQFKDFGTDGSDGSPLAHGKFGTEGVYWTMGEVKSRRPSGNGKLEDLL